jgi:hypothetical protein
MQAHLCCGATGITALGVAVFAAYQKFESFRSGVNMIINAVIGYINGAITAMFTLYNAIAMVINAIPGLDNIAMKVAPQIPTIGGTSVGAVSGGGAAREGGTGSIGGVTLPNIASIPIMSPAITGGGGRVATGAGGSSGGAVVGGAIDKRLYTVWYGGTNCCARVATNKHKYYWRSCNKRGNRSSSDRQSESIQSPIRAVRNSNCVMAGTAVVGAGNYSLEIDTGFIQDAFLLDDAVAGVLDNNLQYVLDGTTNFADVTTGIDSITVRRGRRDQGDQFSAGTMVFNMLDTTGIFNPFDQQSPYFDAATAQPGLAPMRKVRLARYSDINVKEYLFVGYIVNFDYNFALGGIDTVTVYCADDFYLLAQTFLEEFNVSEQLSSARLTAVLDLPEVDFPIGQRNIATGTQTLGGASAFTVDAGTNTLNYCNQINLAEQGRLYMARAGDLTFEPRIGNTLSAPAAIISR